MEDNKFRWYFRMANGASWDWYKVTSGTVGYNTSSTPVNPLSKSPKGWDETFIQWERKFPKLGMFKTYTVPLEFVGDAAKIARYIALNYGTEAKLEIYVEKFNATISVNAYEYYYNCELNLIGESSNKDSVSCEGYEGGVISKLSARETTDYELELNGHVDRIWVRLHPCKLRATQKWIGAPTETVGEDIDGHGVPTLSPSTNEGTNIYFGIYDQMFVPPAVLFLQNEDGSSHDVTLTFNYEYYCTNLSAANAFFEIGYQTYDITNNNTIAHLTVYQDPTAIAASSSAWRTGSKTATITLASNVGLYCEVRMKTSGGTNLLNSEKTMVQGNDNWVEMDTEVMTEEVYFPARRLSSVYRELVDEVTDGDAVAESSLLGTTYNDIVMTSGDGLRNLLYSKIKTSLGEFVDNLDYIFSVANYFDRTTNKLYLETKDVAFDNTQIIDFGEVSNFVRRPFTSEMFANYINGYEEQTYDNVNGKDEPNAYTKWLSSVVRLKVDKTETSSYRADRTGMILTALNLVGKKYTDSGTDNDLWLAHIESSVSGTIPSSYGGSYVGEDYYDLYIDPSLTISNVYDAENLFNVKLTPKRNIIRRGSWIRSILDNLDSTYLKYQVKDKTNATDTKMITDDGVTVINEGSDILISTLGDKYFRAQIFEFDAEITTDINSIMLSNPFGYARCTHKGNELFGWIIKIGESTSFRKKQAVQLLCHPDTDLNNLIY